MKKDIEERCKEMASYMLKNQCTVRALAKRFGVSRSTAHLDVTKRLYRCDCGLHAEVQKLLSKNKAEFSVRGGEATRRKYQK